MGCAIRADGIRGDALPRPGVVVGDHERIGPGMTPDRGAGWLADGVGGHAKVCEECGEVFGATAKPGSPAAARPDVVRCPACRRRRLAARNEQMLAAGATGALGPLPPRAGVWGDAASTRLHAAVCAACGRPARVPFRPRPDRPVYCRACREARNGR